MEASANRRMLCWDVFWRTLLAPLHFLALSLTALKFFLESFNFFVILDSKIIIEENVPLATCIPAFFHLIELKIFIER